MELIKEMSLKEGLEKSINKARDLQNPILFSYSFNFLIRDLLPILSHPADKNTVRVYWEQPSKGIALAGLGSIIEFNDYDNMHSDKIHNQIKKIMEDSISISDSVVVGPKILGGYAFDKYAGKDETWNGFPRTQFILPECLGTSTDDGTWLTISRIIYPDDIVDKTYDKFISTKKYYENRLPVTLPPISRSSVDKYKVIPDQEKYTESILSVLEKIKPNKLDKVVISRSHHVKVGNNFSGVSAMQIMRNAYPRCTSFFFSFPKQGIFFGSTPERLISLKNKCIHTEALAGTIARGNNMEEDRNYADKLLASHKESEEHNFVLEQIIRKLNPIVSEIQYSSTPYVLKLKNVQHLKTSITGKINHDAHILTLVNRLHPTSAVAGTPTDKAMDIIRIVELHDRGWYSGPIGWIDQKGDGEFYVALRSALVRNEEAHIFAGGGIVSESHPFTEWEETELKLQPIISALSGGQK